MAVLHCSMVGMADMTLVREDGGGCRTELTVRVPDSAWAGRDVVVEVVGFRRLVAASTRLRPLLPGQRKPVEDYVELRSP